MLGKVGLIELFIVVFVLIIFVFALFGAYFAIKSAVKKGQMEAYHEVSKREEESEEGEDEK